MPIVSKTLLAGQSETWLLTGSGFSVIAAGSALLSRIEFLRLGKTVEDLTGSFGEGFYFTTPGGAVFDGVRVTAQTSGTFSFFIGHGIAGILEPTGSRPVNVTNSEIAVDVQNAILNTQITNSSLDIDIATQSVDLVTKITGSAANTAGPQIIFGGTNYDTVTGSISGASGDVIEVSVAVDLWSSVYPTVPSTPPIIEVFRGSTLIFSGTDPATAPSSNPTKYTRTIYDNFVGANAYTLRIRRVNTGTNHPVFANANIKAAK